MPKIYRGMQTGVIRFQSEVSVLDFPIIKTILEKFKAHSKIRKINSTSPKRNANR